MIDLESKIRVDASEFISSLDKMQHNDKVQLLVILLQKYALLGKADLVFGKKDLQAIISSSKKNFTDMTMPVEMTDSDTPVHQTEIANLCVIEATIGYLNKQEALKRLPKFSYKKR